MSLMDSDVTIRRARPSDQGALFRLIQAMAKESEGRQLDPDTLQAGIARVFDEPSLGEYWVVETGRDEQIVGCTLMTLEWSDWTNSAYWWFQSVYITPAYRGQGLLQQLMQDIEAEARAQGVREIRLYVDDKNTRAIAAYEKANYTHSHYRLMSKTLP